MYSDQENLSLAKRKTSYDWSDPEKESQAAAEQTLLCQQLTLLKLV